MLRGIDVEIDLAAAAHNLGIARQAAGNSKVIAVMKADAYGHGAQELSRTFERAGASAFAVAFLSEAIELRQAGTRLPIIVMFDRTGPELYFDHALTPVIHDMKTAEMFHREAEHRNTVLDVHIKFDTGMGRMGFTDFNLIPKIAALKGIRIAGLMSHFSEADLADMRFMRHQLDIFNEARHALDHLGIDPLCHFANSAATLAFPDSHLDAVRPGIMLYGCSPFGDRRRNETPLRPVMRARTKIIGIRRHSKGTPISYARTFITTRDTLVAILAAGYADGYPRALSNKAYVLINGQRAPILGRVCMDLTVVDVTDIVQVQEWDDAVLMGASGADSITADELADAASTISYEILLRFGRIGRRSYKGV